MVSVASRSDAGAVALRHGGRRVFDDRGGEDRAAGDTDRQEYERRKGSAHRRNEDNTRPKGSLTSARRPFMYEPGPSSREEARDDDHGDASSDRGHVCG